MKNDQPAPRKLLHFTPLRYPGGKGKLASYVKEILRENRLLDGEYVEPYAGGAAIALELLFHEYVSRIHINDVSKPVYSFWRSVLNQTEEISRMIVDTPLSIESWDRQKFIFRNSHNFSDLQLGFATFFLNRTNRSGILNGGIIGGRRQNGPWKIDARFNSNELTYRIQSIARMRDRISLTRLDALEFVRGGIERWPEETLIYLDPPYYEKGRALYYDFYEHEDHERIARFITETKLPRRQKWIVSYDNVSSIQTLYAGTRYLTYDIGYSARSASSGSEIMFFCDDLRVPPLVGPVKLTEDQAGILANAAS